MYSASWRSTSSRLPLTSADRIMSTYRAGKMRGKREVQSAMIYPAIVIGLALVVVSVLVAFVLPAFANLFGEFRASMPLPTRVLLAVGTFCREHLLEIFVGLGMTGTAIGVYASTKSGRDLLDSLVLRLPMLGVILRYAVIERYLRTLGTLARAGVPITKMLDTAITAVGNGEYRTGLASVKEDMLSGEGFSTPLERTGLFPRIVIQMVRV